MDADMSGPQENAGVDRDLTREELVEIYEHTKTIAVVGASANEEKDAHEIPRYLKSQGYRIIPVNPRGGEILGEKAHASLGEIEAPVDVVDVFRPPSEAEDVARAAVAIGAKVLWFQLDTHTDDAVRIARDGGLTVVTDMCMGAAHRLLGLGPGPSQTNS
jgi:uncharacterized protein